MKRFLCVPILMLLLTFSAKGQALRKDRLFKVDPLSGLFNEIRVGIENRLFGNYFLYLGPHGYFQNWHSKKNERWGRPEHPQKYYGAGIRVGVRRYFIPKDVSPRGLFAQGMLGYRYIFVNNLNANLEIDNRTWLQQLGLGGTVGYQWLYGRKDNIAYGFMGGFEYFFASWDKNDAYPDGFVRNWYEFPFFRNFLNGFRLYLGIEIGFAFKQKHLHW